MKKQFFQQARPTLCASDSSAAPFISGNLTSFLYPNYVKSTFMKKLLLLAMVLLLGNAVFAQYGTITTVAGSGCAGSYGGDGGAATASGVCLNVTSSSGVAVDRAGNIVFADTRNYRIRRIDHSTGIISTIAGTGTSGYSGDGGAATAAQIGAAVGLCVDRSGNTYFIDSGNHFIRKIDATSGLISTIAGDTASPYYRGNGGPATAATLASAKAVYVDSSYNVFVADYSTIRKIDAATQVISLFAGDSMLTIGYTGDGGRAVGALLGELTGISGDGAGNIYASQSSSIFSSGDFTPGLIRKIDPSGIITTVAGNIRGMQLDACPATATSVNPMGLAVDSAGNIFFTEAGGIRKVDAATGILHFLGTSGSSNIATDNSGTVYYNNYQDATVKKLVGATAVFERCYVVDSLTTSANTLPATRSFLISGTIIGTPSSTDSVDVLVTYEYPYYGHFEYEAPTKSFRLPYSLISGSYSFGSLIAFVDTVTYRLPGIYRRTVMLTALSGPASYFVFYDTIGTRDVCPTCGTYTPLRYITDRVTATDTASPCTIPRTVTFTSGIIPTEWLYPDSAYLLFDFDDGSYDLQLVPMGSGTYHSTHTYTSPGRYWPTMFVISPNGDYRDMTMPSSGEVWVEAGACSGGAIISNVIFDHASSSCSAPDTVTYHYFGYLNDSAARSSTATIHMYYGDGTDEAVVLPVLFDSYLSGPRYYFDSYASHVFTSPGNYTSYHYDTAGIYTYSGSIDYGTTPSILTVGTSCAPLTGTFYIDSNSDCSRGAGETGLAYWPYALVNTSVGDTTYGWCDDSGRYALNVVTGYNYTVISNPFGSATSATLAAACPSTGIYTFTATAGGALTQDFAFTCTTPSTIDMGAAGWVNRFRPGFSSTISIWASNPWGYICDSLSSQVTLVLDSRLTYAGMHSGPTPTTISGDTLIWNLQTTRSMLDFHGEVSVNTLTSVSISDTIYNRVSVTPTRISDPNMANNTYSWATIVRTSYDPNDKEVSPLGWGSAGYVPNNTPLSYRVRFQNTGTAEATNITIVDTLSTALDLSTLQVISSSAPVHVYQAADHVVKFRFDNINLPDSTTDLVGSNGYVSFNIVPLDSLAPGTVIANTAHIYFDYNPGIATNTTINTIEDTIGVIAGPDSVCAGGSITLTNHIAGGTWRASNGHASVVGGVVTGVSNGADTIYYTVYDHVTASKVIYVADGATVSAGVLTGPGSVCVAASVTLTPSVSGGVWSVSSASVASVAGGMVTGVAAGVDTVIYTVSNSCGSDVARTTVTVNPLPVAGSITGGGTVCPASSITLMPSIGGGAWSLSSGAIATISGSVVTGIAAGIDTVSYTVTNSCGSDVARTIVTVNPLPIAGSISGAGSVCPGASVTLTPSVSGGAWVASSGTIATVSGGVVTGVAAGLDTISYTVTNICGTDVATAVITVNPLPSAGTLSGGSTVCVGATDTISSTVAGGTWTISSGSLASVSGGVVTGIMAGVDTVTYTVTNSCGTDVAHTSITVNPLPSAGTITGTDSVCVGSAVVLHTSSSTGSWGSASSSVIARVTTSGIVSGIAAGVDTITFSSTNSCGTDVARAVVRVNPLPNAGSVTGGSSACAGATDTLTASVAGGVWLSANSSIATVSAGVVRAVSGGTTDIYYVQTNSCGSDTARLSFTAHPLPDAGTLSGSGNVCVGNTLTLTPSVIGGVWSASNASVNVAGGVVTGVTAGSAYVSYAVTNSCGISNITSLILAINQPNAGVIAGATALCPSDTTTLTNAAPGGTWSSSNGAVATVNGSGVVRAVSSGTAAISYSVANSCGNATATSTMLVRAISDCPAAVTTVENNKDISIYPNPSNGSFTLTLPMHEGDVVVTVVDIQGQIVKEVTVTDKRTSDIQIDITNVAAGVYLVKTEVDGKVYRRKIVVM